MWTCPDCDVTVFGDPQQHSCKAKRDRVARGFEAPPGQRPRWMVEASPDEELLTRVRSFVGDRYEWGWKVSFDGGRLIRRIEIDDPDFRPRLQIRELSNWEDWEEVFRELGLLL